MSRIKVVHKDQTIALADEVAEDRRVERAIYEWFKDTIEFGRNKSWDVELFQELFDGIERAEERMFPHEHDHTCGNSCTKGLRGRNED